MKEGKLLTITITKHCIQDLRAAIKASHPKEAGGFILGTNTQLRRAVPLPNISAEPETEYRTYWREGLAFAQHYSDWIDHRTPLRGKTIVRAFWHSHPKTHKAIPTGAMRPGDHAGDYGFIGNLIQMFGSHEVTLNLIVSYEDLRRSPDFTLINSFGTPLPLKLPNPYKPRK